jgi:hypothetical protein
MSADEHLSSSEAIHREEGGNADLDHAGVVDHAEAVDRSGPGYTQHRLPE